jgi:hypothetical protein
MEETKVMLGILLISAIAVTFYLVASTGTQGAAISQSYIACCCNILDTDGEQVFIRGQVQTWADNCEAACQRYSHQGYVFPQTGLCAANP